MYNFLIREIRSKNSYNPIAIGSCPKIRVIKAKNSCVKCLKFVPQNPEIPTQYCNHR